MKTKTTQVKTSINTVGPAGTMAEEWIKEYKRKAAEARESQNYDDIIEALAAKKMASPSFAGDYEMALSSAQLAYDLAAELLEEI